MKKAIILSILAIFALNMPLWAQNSESDFEVILTQDMTGAVITNYVGKSQAVIIPASIQGMPVKEIGANAFSPKNTYAYSRKSNISSVTIPQGVTIIGESAFSDCENLKTIIIPEGVVDIGKNAFRNCASLTDITLPSTIWKIQESAFTGCTVLTTVTIPASVRWIDIARNAFSGTPKLTLASQLSIRKFENTPASVKEEVMAAIRQRSTVLINPGTSYQATLGSKDKHLYRTQIEGDGFSEFTAFTTGRLDTYMRLYDSSMKEIAKNDDGGQGGNARIRLPFAGTGTYYIEVTELDGDPGSYTLHVEVSNVNFNSTPINQGTSYPARFNRGEEHWYSVQVTKDETLTAYTTGDLDTYIEIYSPNMHRISGDDDSGQGYNARARIIVSAGTYYIKVVELDDDSGPYTLHVE